LHPHANYQVAISRHKVEKVSTYNNDQHQQRLKSIKTILKKDQIQQRPKSINKKDNNNKTKKMTE
jgi:hypothetical protein